MSLREALLIALRGLGAHRLRSALTMRGLITGVSAVILLVACGQGVQTSVRCAHRTDRQQHHHRAAGCQPA